VILVGVGVGSSGPRAHAQVRRGLDALYRDPWFTLVSQSPVAHSAPAGGVTRQRFANAAALIETPLHPEAVLGRLLAIERQLGRVRSRKNAARALDLDVLWTDGRPRASARLTLPHPQLRARPFALEPLRACFRRAKRPVPPTLR
jgi:2-amino-4-hydroxy-6-hydroxymethyldihydropteridine diphosphokinase